MLGDKRVYLIFFFVISFNKTHVVGTEKNYLNETDLLSIKTHVQVDWLHSLKSLSMSYHILVASLKQSHQSKTSYKYMI